MATNDLGYRFTEETYATKSEVSRALNTSLVDSIWSNILMYRVNFNHYTKLCDVSKNLFKICYCKSVLEKASDLESKFVRLNDRYSGLKVNTLEKYQIDKPALMKILRAASRELNIYVNDVALDNIIARQPVGNEYAPLVNYYKALLYIDSYNSDALDDNLIAKLFNILCGGGELNAFYRTSEFVSYQSKALINREYEGIPSRLIEDSMNNMFDFLADEEISISFKLAIAYYMVNFIKPFDKYNELIAVLLMKYLLLRRGTAGATFIPFELIVDKAEALKPIFKEVQKTRDLTYIVTRFIPLASSYTSEILDDLVKLNVTQARDAFYGKDELEGYNSPNSFIETPKYVEEKPVEERVAQPQPVFEEPSKEENPVEEPVEAEVQPVEEEEPVFEKPQEMNLFEESYEEEATPEEEEEPEEEPARDVRPEPKEVVLAMKKERKPYEHKMVKRDKKAPVSQSEAELIEQEEDMLESDPSLKAHQAHFYVRHNTVGKFYTIQQYKRLEGCVYETARTSMDNLAKKGYYKREQVKNKFVYTPIKRD